MKEFSNNFKTKNLIIHRLFQYITLIFFIKILNFAEATAILCERISTFGWDDIYNQRTCYLNTMVEIKTADVTLTSSDYLTKGMYFHKNRKIHYLPIDVYKNFPKLLAISASYCSVKALTYRNFEKLTFLSLLWLEFNQLERIDKNVFSDLKSLERLELGKNNFFSL